jgi:putative transposase
VARLMRQAELRGRTPKRWKKTTIPDPDAAARADLIRRDFTVDAAAINSRWCGDSTYVPTRQGWLFLATVIDISSRKVVGHAIGDHLRASLVADALTNAVAARNPAAGVIFHSDRGCQYTSAHLADLAVDYQVRLSVGRTGQCWDNALAESFFASLKGECLNTQPCPPEHTPATPSSTTSPGTTTPGSTQPSATRHPPSTSTPTNTSPSSR